MDKEANLKIRFLCKYCMSMIVEARPKMTSPALFWIQDVSGNLGEMPKGKDLKGNSIEAQAGKAI